MRFALNIVVKFTSCEAVAKREGVRLVSISLKNSNEWEIPWNRMNDAMAVNRDRFAIRISEIVVNEMVSTLPTFLSLMMAYLSCATTTN